MSTGKKIYNRDVNVTGSVSATGGVSATGALSGATLSVGSKTVPYVIVYAGQATTTGGAAAEDVTVTGALATDIAFAVIEDNGTNNVTLLQTAADADKITLTFSADPGNDAVVNYQVLRAV